MARLSDGDIARIIDAARPVAPAPAGWLEQAEHRRLTVHCTGGTSIEGVLRLAAPDGLLLWNPSVLASPKAITLDGEVFIPRDQVLFVQTVRN